MAIKSDGKTLTARQQKAKVLEWTGWSSEQYNREYDKLRNKVRAYEKITHAQKGSINVADLIAREARGKFFAARYGEEYKRTEELTAILNTPSISSGREVSQKARERVISGAYARVDKQFYGVIVNSKYAADFQRITKKLMEEGRLTPYIYKALAEKYARMLGAEKENVRKFNEASPDTYEKMYFTST